MGSIAKSFEIKQISKEDNKLIEHKHINYYSDFHFIIMLSSEHILVDITFIFPPEFVQTIIIMYYESIVYKFIQGIYRIITNKFLIINKWF